MKQVAENSFPTVLFPGFRGDALAGINTCNSRCNTCKIISHQPGTLAVHGKVGGRYHCEGSFDVVELPCWRKTVSGLEMSSSLVIWYGTAEHVVKNASSCLFLGDLWLISQFKLSDEYLNTYTCLVQKEEMA